MTHSAGAKRFEVWLVKLAPTVGSEIQKIRPCVVVSPDGMNAILNTIFVAPMTSTRRDWPSRISIDFEKVLGAVAADQIRSVDKKRLVKKLGHLSEAEATKVCDVLVEMFEK